MRFPRPRGDEPTSAHYVASGGRVFPAHAGMSRPYQARGQPGRCFPRPRGDEPKGYAPVLILDKFSPPTRG